MQPCELCRHGMHAYGHMNIPGVAEWPPSMCFVVTTSCSSAIPLALPCDPAAGKCLSPPTAACHRVSQESTAPALSPMRAADVFIPPAEFIFLGKQLFRGTFARDNWNGEERILRLGAQCFLEVFKSAPGSRANLVVI